MTAINPMQIIKGDIWEAWTDGAYIVISTNLQGIHGRGLAKQAADRRLIRNGHNRCFAESAFADSILCVAVKGWAPETARIPGKAYSEQCVGNNLLLLQWELQNACAWHAAQTATEHLVIPFVGAGFGEGSLATLMPIYERILAPFPRASLISLDPQYISRYTTALAPGVRQDHTLKGN
jgi:hypothetical protein